MSKPTVDEIKEIASQRGALDGGGYWSELHKLQKERQAYYLGKNKITLPEGLHVTQITSRAAYDWVSTGRNNYLLDNPCVEVTPRNESKTSKDDAAVMETFGTSLLRRNVAKIRDNTTLQLAIGAGAYKLELNDAFVASSLRIEGLKKGWKQIPEEDRKDIQDLALTQYPIRILAPHFVNLFPSPYWVSDYQPYDMIEAFEITVAEARGLCRMNGWSWKPKDEKKEKDKVKYLVYYSPEWRCVLIDDKPVFRPHVMPNPLGFCPYLVFDAGMGIPSYEGDMTDRFRGIIAPNMGLIDLETKTMTQLGYMDDRFAFPKLIAHIEAGMSEEEALKLIGDKLDLNPEELGFELGMELRYLETTGQGQAQLVQFLAVLSAKASPPTGMAGGHMPGVYSGQYASMRIAQERTWYKDPFKIHEDVLALVASRGFQTIDQIIKHPISVEVSEIRKGEPSSVTKIGPDNIREYYKCKVKLLADSPEASDIKKHLGQLTYQAGIYDHETTLTEFYDKSKAEAESIADAVLIEQTILKSPTIQMLLAEKAARATGQDDLADAVKMVGMTQQHGGSRVHPGASSEPATKSVTQQKRPQNVEPAPSPTEIQTGQ